MAGGVARGTSRTASLPLNRSVLRLPPLGRPRALWKSGDTPADFGNFNRPRSALTADMIRAVGRDALGGILSSLEPG